MEPGNEARLPPALTACSTTTGEPGNERVYVHVLIILFFVMGLLVNYLRMSWITLMDVIYTILKVNGQCKRHTTCRLWYARQMTELSE